MRFSLSRCSSSCHLAARCHRLYLLASSSCSRCLVLAPLSSLLPCRLRPFPSPVFSYGFLIVLLPVLAISRAGRSLLACPCVVVLVSFALFFLCLVSPAFACYGNYSRSFPSSSLSSSSHAVARLLPLVLCPSSHRVSSPPVRLFSPSFDKRGRGACRLVICLLALVLVVRAANRASAGMVCCLAWLRVGVLCSVCVVGVCIYRLGACSCMMDVVERKRTRKDFRR